MDGLNSDGKRHMSYLNCESEFQDSNAKASAYIGLRNSRRFGALGGALREFSKVNTLRDGRENFISAFPNQGDTFRLQKYGFDLSGNR